ncbi:MAG: LptF/LptG family permease, partial [Acidobacteriota bacterium]
ITYVLPDSNHAVRQLLFQVLASKANTDIRPRVFYDTLFPNMMFLVMDMPTGTERWQNVFVADLSTPSAPRLTLAREGQLAVDAKRRTVSFFLKDGEVHQVDYNNPRARYNLHSFAENYLPLQAEVFFPPDEIDVPRGAREMSLGGLYEAYQETDLPVYLVEIHKKFSIPFACFVFGVLGLALGIRNRREGRSWGFVVSIGVIFIYYVLIQLGENAAKQGRMPPLVAMWTANAVLGVVGLILLTRNAREAHASLPSLGQVYTAVRRWLPLPGLFQPPRGRTVPARSRSRPVVILRIPRVVVRFPNTLDRYVTREFFRYFALILAALVVVYVLGVLIDVLEDVFEHNVKGKLVFQYLAAILPQVLFHMLPLATLTATLVNFAILTKTSEITAIKAGGTSLYRISLPVILVGLGVSTMCFGIQEYILAYSNRRAAEIRDEIRRRPVQTHNLLNRQWMLGRDQQIYHYAYYDPDRKRFNGIAVYRYDRAAFRLTHRLYAHQAEWDPAAKAWVFEKGWTRDFEGEGRNNRFDRLVIRDMEPPDHFIKEEKHSDQMTYLELSAYIHDLEAGGFDVVRLRVALHSKFSFPLAAMVTVLIGVPFSFTPGKKGALYGIGIAIAIGLSYYVTTRVFAFMGESAILPPLLAAWAPNVLFGVGALYGLFNVKT